MSDNYENENGESFVMTISLESLSDSISYTTKAYDFLPPTYALSVKIEVVKPRGIVDETAIAYMNAVSMALDRFVYHYQGN